MEGSKLHATVANIALLAPVPAEHLKSALELLKTEEKVAFGSMNFLLFHELDLERQGLPVDVYIYASGKADCPDAPPLWRAVYTGFTPCSPTKHGSHPDEGKYRPDSTKKYSLDNEGHWLVFWEVIDLRPASPQDWWSIEDMTGYRKKKRYGKSFVPEGPYLIKHPLYPSEQALS
jgi:hypothetical protein